MVRGRGDRARGRAEVVSRGRRGRGAGRGEGRRGLVGKERAARQGNIYAKALKFRGSMITKVDTFGEFERVLDEKGGFVLAPWDGTTETELEIKERTKATIRCIPFDTVDEEGVDMLTGKPSHRRVLFARSY